LSPSLETCPLSFLGALVICIFACWRSCLVKRGFAIADDLRWFSHQLVAQRIKEGVEWEGDFLLVRTYGRRSQTKSVKAIVAPTTLFVSLARLLARADPNKATILLVSRGTKANTAGVSTGTPCFDF
jgi:hypothetical protein